MQQLVLCVAMLSFIYYLQIFIETSVPAADKLAASGQPPRSEIDPEATEL